MWISKADNSHLAFREMYTSNTTYYVFRILKYQQMYYFIMAYANKKRPIFIGRLIFYTLILKVQ